MKLWYSYLKELKLSSKGFYFYIEVLMTVIIIVLLLFVIPENMITTHEEYITLDLPDDIKNTYLDFIEEKSKDQVSNDVEMKLNGDVIQAKKYTLEGKELYIIPNEKDMIELTQKDRPLIGVTISWDENNNDFQYDYYLQGYEANRLKNLYRILHSRNLVLLSQEASKIKVQSLETGYEQLNSREMAIPSLITFNGSLMGLFIIAAYIFLDKQEGVIKAYAVTASKVWEYLMSKALTLMTVTVITTLAIVIPVMGLQPNYFALLMLLLTSAFFASSLGLVISSFFDNMSQAFGAIYVVMMLFMLPAIAYFIPSWNPLWIKFIPIHYLIQGFKETILVNGDMMYVFLSSLGFLASGILLFLFANHRFKGNLTV